MRSRGMALISVLLFLVVLLMTTVSLVARARGGAFFQMEGQADVAALYAAEAGVNDALALWSADDAKTWGQNPATDNLIKQPLQGGEGTFTIKFGAGQSVNNLNGGAAVDGPQGPGTVPPRSAYLVVTGEARGQTRLLEVVVARTGFLTNPIAMLSNNEVQMNGNVTITGLRSMLEPVEVDADLVSLASNGNANLVDWTGPGSVNVHGAISSNGSSGSAISASLSSANITGGTLTGQSRANVSKVDIAGRIAAKSGLPAPVLSGSVTTLNNQDYYVNGDLNYNGDLALGNVNLYVSGQLNLNGTVRGTGSVFVGSSSHLQGDTSISSGDAQGIALFSKGDVVVSGFNGTAYLEDRSNLAAAPDANNIPYSTHFNNAKNWGAAMVAQIPSSPPPVGSFQQWGAQMSDFDRYLAALTILPDPAVEGTMHVSQVGIDATYSGPLGRLNELVLAQPPGPTRNFLDRKLKTVIQDANLTSPQHTQGVLGARSTYMGSMDQLRQSLATGSVMGLGDGGNDAWELLMTPTLAGTGGFDGNAGLFADLIPRRDEIFYRVRNVMNQMDFNHPGSAFFQGLVYTEGDLVAQDDIKVLGSLLATGPNSKIVLKNGVSVTYVPELARQAGQSLGLVGVHTWIRR